MAERFEFSLDELRTRFVDHWNVAETYCHEIGQEFGVKLRSA
jgi:hypothetical protein